MQLYRSEYSPGELITITPRAAKWLHGNKKFSKESLPTSAVVLEYTPANVYDSAYVRALYEGREVYVECKDIKRAV